MASLPKWLASLAVGLLLLSLPGCLACSSCGTSRFPGPGACVVQGIAVEPKVSGCCADAQAVHLAQRLNDVLGGKMLRITLRSMKKKGEWRPAPHRSRSAPAPLPLRSPSSLPHQGAS